jgi:mandelate racemase
MDAVTHHSPRVQRVIVRTVVVPVTPPLHNAVGTIATAPLVLADLHTDHGVTGRAYAFAYAGAALAALASLTVGLGESLVGQPLAPAALTERLRARARLLGTDGLVGMAIGLLDMAAWDALGRAADLPLARLLGADGDQPIDTYCSLRGWSAQDVAAQAGEAVAAGFRAVKLKFGHKTLAAEREVLRAVREAIGTEVAVMVDYNQALGVPEALHRARALADEGLAWIEEPVLATDHEGHARVAAAAETPIMLGENCWSAADLGRVLAAGAGDYVMPDVNKIGGVTAWMAGAALADAAGVPVSSHLYIEHSAHLLAACPGRQYLEYLDLAAPIRAAGAPRWSDGRVMPGLAAGAGLEWDEDAVARYQAA